VTSIGSTAKRTIAKLPIAAAIVALAGIADATYLTIHHYTAEAVPCGAEFDCEMVLTSKYADIGGIPLSIFGALAYIVAFSLAVLSISGKRPTWNMYGIQATMMAIVSGYLIYVQHYYIHAWCQYCLISAATSFTLFLIFLVSFFFRPRQAG
jgi:uncharacterized membrane protein